MNMFKSNGGFTLVELIVVIAIIAILASVAVPAYSGYITKANEVQDKVDDAAVKTAVTAACSYNGIPMTSAITWEVDANGVITVSGSGEDTDVSSLANELYKAGK